MERITYRKTLDVHKNGVQFTLQGFTTQDNMSRVIEISLMSSGDTIDFPLERITAMMYTITPGADVADVDSCEIVGNKVVYVVPRIPTAGITKMTVQLIETDVNGAKSTYCTPQFAIEVIESDADNEPAEKTPSFTALLDSTARAKQVYDQRFVRMEFLEDGTFNAYYADGTVYTNTALAKFIVDTASGGEVDWSAVVSKVTSIITANDIAPEVKTILDAQYAGKWGKAEYSGDLGESHSEPIFVKWDANSADTPYTAGITTQPDGFALVYGMKDAIHTTIAWALGDDKPVPYIRIRHGGKGDWRTSNGWIDLENDTVGLLPISSGGTGAENPADARNELNVYGKDETHALLGGDMIWENPTPNDEFKAQTIELDLSEYKRIAVVGDEYEGRVVCHEKNTSYKLWRFTSDGCVGRSVTFNDTGVSIGSYSSGFNTNNSMLIPQKIIGYKY